MIFPSYIWTLKWIDDSTIVKTTPRPILKLEVPLSVFVSLSAGFGGGLLDGAGGDPGGDPFGLFIGLPGDSLDSGAPGGDTEGADIGGFGAKGGASLGATGGTGGGEIVGGEEGTTSVFGLRAGGSTGAIPGQTMPVGTMAVLIWSTDKLHVSQAIDPTKRAPGRDFWVAEPMYTIPFFKTVGFKKPCKPRARPEVWYNVVIWVVFDSFRSFLTS